MSTTEKTNVYHWYVFTFMSHDHGITVYNSHCMGFPEQKVTAGKIDEARKKAGFEGSAMIMNISYLGLMSKSEFECQ